MKVQEHLIYVWLKILKIFEFQEDSSYQASSDISGASYTDIVRYCLRIYLYIIEIVFSLAVVFI